MKTEDIEKIYDYWNIPEDDDFVKEFKGVWEVPPITMEIYFETH